MVKGWNKRLSQPAGLQSNSAHLLSADAGLPYSVLDYPVSGNLQQTQDILQICLDNISEHKRNKDRSGKIQTCCSLLSETTKAKITIYEDFFLKSL